MSRTIFNLPDGRTVSSDTDQRSRTVQFTLPDGRLVENGVGKKKRERESRKMQEEVRRRLAATKIHCTMVGV